MKIYISPANHTKPYITGHNEKQQMEIVGKKICEILSVYDCATFYPTVFHIKNNGRDFINGDYAGRPQEAKQLGADVYVSIHSNAAAAMGSYATGAVGFYHPNSADGKALAKLMQERLDAACPIKSNRYDKTVNGMTFISGGLGEIREPYSLGMTSVLIETNFHSYEPTCRWIVNSTAVIAQQISDALIEQYGLKRKSTKAKPGDTNNANTAKLPENPAEATEAPTAIKAGMTVKIKSNSVYGGESSGRGTPVSAWAISLVHVVKEIRRIKGEDEALLMGINSWVAVGRLTKV